MILLKHKPVLLQHFDPYGTYDVGKINMTDKMRISNANSKIGSHCLNVDKTVSYDASNRYYSGYYFSQSFEMYFTKEFSFSSWVYFNYSDWNYSYYYMPFFYIHCYTNTNWGGLGYGWRDSPSSNWFEIRNAQDNYKADNKTLSSNLSGYDKKWTHFEFNRDKNGYFYAFVNGNLVLKYNLNPLFNGVTYTNRMNLNIGGTYIDELLVTQHCLHTSNFTPPTKPYYWLDRNKLYSDNNNIYGKEIEQEELNKIYI